jgi:hypothetical protein
MTSGQERLMEIRQPSHDRTPCPSAAYHQHAHLPFEQFRVDAVNLHDQLLNVRFRERRILVASRQYRSGTELETASCRQGFSTTQ